MREQDAQRQAEQAEADRTSNSPYTGKFFDVAQKLKQNDGRGAVALALEWHEQDPGDVLALIALGEAAETAGDPITAARAYGSIIDLLLSRADLRRYVGARLERLGEAGSVLAVDTFCQGGRVAAGPPVEPSTATRTRCSRRASQGRRSRGESRAGATPDDPWGRFARSTRSCARTWG